MEPWNSGTILVFHGGKGATLEMREFGMTELGRQVSGCRLPRSRFSDGQPDGHWDPLRSRRSQPLVARREPFVDGPVRQKPDDPGMAYRTRPDLARTGTREGLAAQVSLAI